MLERGGQVFDGRVGSDGDEYVRGLGQNDPHPEEEHSGHRQKMIPPRGGT